MRTALFANLAQRLARVAEREFESEQSFFASAARREGEFESEQPFSLARRLARIAEREFESE